MHATVLTGVLWLRRQFRQRDHYHNQRDRILERFAVACVLSCRGDSCGRPMEGGGPRISSGLRSGLTSIPIKVMEYSACHWSFLITLRGAPPACARGEPALRLLLNRPCPRRSRPCTGRGRWRGYRHHRSCRQVASRWLGSRHSSLCTSPSRHRPPLLADTPCRRPSSRWPGSRHWCLCTPPPHRRRPPRRDSVCRRSSSHWPGRARWCPCTSPPCHRPPLLADTPCCGL